mgnify:CR=1 FL=1
MDIKVAVDDTDLQYLSYQLGKINEEAYEKEKQLAWLEQNRLIRGNPIRTFEGRGFKEI